MAKISKDFLVNILRSAFITKEDATILYQIIHDKCIEAMMQGDEVNLFDLVAIRGHVSPSHERNALGGKRIVVPERSVVKSRIYPKLKAEWKFINDY